MSDKSEVRLIDANAADVVRIDCFYSDQCRLEKVQEWLDDQPTLKAVPAERLGEFGELFMDYKGCPRGAVGRACMPIEEEVLRMKDLTDVDGGKWIPVNADALHELVEKYTALSRTKKIQALTLNDLRDAIYEDAVAHGLWETDGEKFYPEIMRCRAAYVIRKEVFELVVASDDEEAYAEELADVIIASLSAAGKLGIDIDAAVRRKMEINKARPWKHGKDEKK